MKICSLSTIFAAFGVAVVLLAAAPQAAAGPYIGDPNEYEPDAMAVGAGPKGVALVGNMGATANFSDNTITVFEPCAPKSCLPRSVTTIPVGRGPSDVAVWSPTVGRGRIYVTNSADSTISILAYNYNANPTFQPAVSAVVGGEPTGIAITGDGTVAYIADKVANALLYFDTASMKVTDIVPVAAGPWGVVLSPDGSRAYVAGNSGNAVSVVDTSAHKVVATIPVGHAPGEIALDATGQVLAVPNNADGTVSIIDTHANAVVSTARVGQQPWGVSINQGYAYVANYGGASVSVVDLEGMSTIATVSTGGSPFGVVSNDPYTILVTNTGSNLLQSISLAMVPREVRWSSSAKARTVTGRLPMDGGVSYSMVATRGAKHTRGNCRLAPNGRTVACTVKLTKGTWRVSVKTKLPWQPEPYGQQNKRFTL